MKFADTFFFFIVVQLGTNLIKSPNELGENIRIYWNNMISANMSIKLS